jgi:hypothetical protein
MVSTTVHLFLVLSVQVCTLPSLVQGLSGNVVEIDWYLVHIVYLVITNVVFSSYTYCVPPKSFDLLIPLFLCHDGASFLLCWGS